MYRVFGRFFWTAYAVSVIAWSVRICAERGSKGKKRLLESRRASVPKVWVR